MQLWFSNLTMPVNCLGILVKCRFLFSKSGLGTESLHLQQVPRWCWSLDHTWNSKAFYNQQSPAQKLLLEVSQFQIELISMAFKELYIQQWVQSTIEPFKFIGKVSPVVSMIYFCISHQLHHALDGINILKLSEEMWQWCCHTISDFYFRKVI